MIAQLSPKRKISQAGVLTLGGHTVDPGYEGPLLIGLLNVASKPFILKPGRKLIAASLIIYVVLGLLATLVVTYFSEILELIRQIVSNG